MWKITADLEEAKAMRVYSCDFDEQHEAKLVYRLCMVDGDRIPDFEGVSAVPTSGRALDTLEDFGEGQGGCSYIQYLEGEKWSLL